MVAHRERKNRHDLIAIDEIAIGINGQAAIRIAIVCNSEICHIRNDCTLQLLDVRGAAIRVDVDAIRVGVDLDHVRTRATVRLGCGVGRSSIGTVDNDAQTIESMRHRRDQVIDVVLDEIGTFNDPTDISTRRTIPRLIHARFDRILDRVVEFRAALCEELDAVVRHRVVRCGQHHTEIRAGVRR